MSDTPETEAAWAQKELSSIHRWIERNHADGFIDSLTYPQNLERVTDNWHDRFDNLERELNEARTIIEDAKRSLNATEYEGILLSAMRVMEERDEAGKVGEAFSELAWNLEGRLNEAREQNAKLRDIAERAIVAVFHKTTEDILRAELDQLKEGAA